MTNNRTHFTGASSELLVAYKLADQGWEIFFPLMTQSQIDLIAYKEGKTERIQVKTLSKINTEGKQYLQARLQSRGSGSGYVRTYTEDQFDKIAFVFEDLVWLCPWSLLWKNKSVTLGRFEDGVLKARKKRRNKGEEDIDFSMFVI